MIPGEITCFAKFRGIVNENDFWLLIGYQKLLQTSLSFLVKFLFRTDTFGSIGWPSLSPRLHIGDGFEIHILH